MLALKMTPYSRHTEKDVAGNLMSMDERITEVDFNIMVYQKV